MSVLMAIHLKMHDLARGLAGVRGPAKKGTGVLSFQLPYCNT